MILRENIIYVLEKLNNSGFEAYIVGGCVRDNLLGKIPVDYDITTNALPDEIKNVFSDLKIIDNNGEKHGTVTIRYNHENIEITTFRTDGDYLDHRHPDNVKFTRNLKEDLLRRDFTINAMAMDINLNLYDYFNGKEDLKNKVVKCVGTPTNRFTEDALRILRGLRFASTLQFEIEESTLDAMFNLRDTLSYVSKERIKVELDKMICGKYFTKLMRNNKVREIFATIIPDIRLSFDFDQKSKYHPNDLYNHTLNVVENVSSNHIVKLAALFHDLGKVSSVSVEYKDGVEIYHFFGHEEKSYEIAKKTLKNLKYSNDEIEKITWLVLYHDYKFSIKPKSVKKFMRHLPGRDDSMLIDLLIDLKKSDSIDHINSDSFDFDSIRRNYDEIISSGECFNLKTLKIDGNILINLGYSGKEIGKILNELVDLVVDLKLENDKDKLIEYVTRTYKKEC